MKNAPFLTIAIPTWKRPEAVRKRLAELSKQIVAGVELVVYENGGTEETRDAVAPFLNEQIHYAPSSSNQGMTHNFLRCIQDRDSEWLWMLGDDDSIFPESVSKLLKWLDVDQATKFITTRPFSDPTGHKLAIDNVKGLFDATSLDEALFISSTVWRRGALKSKMGVFVDSAYTMSPQLCAMLSILDDESSNAVLHIDSLLTPKVDGHRWSRLRFMKCAPAILDFVGNSGSREATAKALWSGWLWAAEDSLKEVKNQESLDKWRDAFWMGIWQYRRYFSVNRFVMGAMLKAMKYVLVKKHAVGWQATAVLTDRNALSLISKIHGN